MAGQPDLPDILRFIMHQAEPEYWSTIASAVAGFLPKEEAFTLLRDALARVDHHTANLTQGIAFTKRLMRPALLRIFLVSGNRRFNMRRK